MYFARKYSQSSSYTDDSGNRTEANPASPLGPTSPGHSTYRRAMSSPDTGQFVNNASVIDYRSPALHRRLDVTSSPPAQANVTPSQGHRVSPQGHVTSPRAGNVVSPSGTSSSGRVSQSQQNVQRTSTMQPYSNSHTQCYSNSHTQLQQQSQTVLHQLKPFSCNIRCMFMTNVAIYYILSLISLKRYFTFSSSQIR